MGPGQTVYVRKAHFLFSTSKAPPDERVENILVHSSHCMIPSCVSNNFDRRADCLIISREVTMRHDICNCQAQAERTLETFADLLPRYFVRPASSHYVLKKLLLAACCCVVQQRSSVLTPPHELLRYLVARGTERQSDETARLNPGGGKGLKRHSPSVLSGVYTGIFSQPHRKNVAYRHPIISKANSRVADTWTLRKSVLPF